MHQVVFDKQQRELSFRSLSCFECSQKCLHFSLGEDYQRDETNANKNQSFTKKVIINKGDDLNNRDYLNNGDDLNNGHNVNNGVDLQHGDGLLYSGATSFPH